MNAIHHPRFTPREGAVLDLESLRLVADVPDAMLSTLLGMHWPDAGSLVVEGLELSGTAAPTGPPGTVRPDSGSTHAVLSPGRAIVCDRRSRRSVIIVEEPVHIPWPDATGPRVRGVLAIHAAQAAVSGAGGIAVARDTVEINIGFVKPQHMQQPNLLPLAAATGNGQDWATDIRRVFQPEHPAIRTLLKRFERLEQTVWKAEPEGAVWDRQILGRSWVRYQTVAASALQAARMQLATRQTTTLERIRLLTELRIQLERSVERTATELLQLVGPGDGAGPYQAVANAR